MQLPGVPGGLRAGDIVVTEGSSRDLWGRIIRWGAKSPWTHVFLMVDAKRGVESWFPSGVRELDASSRLADVQAGGRAIRVIRPVVPAGQIDDAVTAALRMVGRRYDAVQAVAYALLGRFVDDGPKRVICSRYITAAFEEAGADLFPLDFLRRNGFQHYARVEQLRVGWVTPKELLLFAEGSVFDAQHGPIPLFGRGIIAR